MIFPNAVYSYVSLGRVTSWYVSRWRQDIKPSDLIYVHLDDDNKCSGK